MPQAKIDTYAARNRIAFPFSGELEEGDKIVAFNSTAHVVLIEDHDTDHVWATGHSRTISLVLADGSVRHVPCVSRSQWELAR